MPSLALACRLIAVSLASRRPFSPASLFSSGEQGVWYDPSDFSTMFQDAEGTKPVTAIGQPVGLMLDKSKGLVLGSEVIPQPLDFTSAAWRTIGALSTVTTNSFTNTSGAGAGKLYIVTAGKRYTVSVAYTKSDASTQFGVYDPTGASPVVTSIAASGTLTAVYQPAGTGFYLRLAGNATVTVTSISVRELPGNHATQSTTTSRPVLSARVNLLTKTEQFGDMVWDKAANVSVTDRTTEVTAPDGTYTATKLLSPAGSGSTYVRQLFTIPLTAHSGSIWVRRGNYRYFGLRVVNNTPLAGDYVVLDFDANDGAGGIVFVPPTENVSHSFKKIGDWFEFRVTNLPNDILRYYQIGISDAFGGEAPSVPAGSYVYVWHPDLRVANDGINLPPYQRVNTATDYDTAGFPYYLSFDGVDDWMVTPSIDFTATDKMTVFAGVRKLSDAALYSVVAELSANWTQNNGAFALMAPFDGAGTYSSGAKGDAAAAGAHYATMSGATSPDSAVLTATHSISGDLSTIKRNGVSGTNGTADKGAGNYGNYPLYIGRRGGTTFPFNGRLYGLIVRGAATDATQLEQTEQWINSKMGGIY